jgi:ABC-2 type transport system ATP-binding protein
VRAGASLECRALSKRYGRRLVLDAVDLSADPGEILALTGENGSGKSTLLRCLAGYERADRGTAELRGGAGYCPQEDCLEPRATVAEHLALIASASSPGGLARARREELLERFALSRCLRERAGRLSGGSRQKLKFLLCLIPDPEVLLLDEAYEGFDLGTYGEFWRTLGELAREGRTILLACHLVHERERCSRVLALAGGRILDA